MEDKFKKKIKEYVDMLDRRDAIFIERIYTILKSYLEKTGRL